MSHFHPYEQRLKTPSKSPRHKEQSSSTLDGLQSFLDAADGKIRSPSTVTYLQDNFINKCSHLEFQEHLLNLLRIRNFYWLVKKL